MRELRHFRQSPPGKRSLQGISETMECASHQALGEKTMAESTGHFKCRILFYLCIFFGMAFVVGICAPAGAGSTPAYGAHPAITNISPQNTDPGVVSPATHTGSISNAIPVTFTTDPVTKRSYVSNHIIVRFKSRNDGGLSVSADKIQTAHAKAGAKVLKDFSAGGLTGLQLIPAGKRDRYTNRD